MLTPGRALTFANVAEGAEGLVVSDLARAVAARPKPPAVSLAVVCRDGPRMQQLARALEFFAPDLPVMQFPAWDCQPYDRVSPHGGILAQRLTTLARLSRLKGSDKPLIVLTTVNAITQRVPARETVAAQALSVAPGHVVPMDSIIVVAGAQRLQPLLHRARARRICRARRHPRPVSGRARPAGAVRFLRRHAWNRSALSTRKPSARCSTCAALDLVPVSEFQLVTETIRRFRMGYVAAFGAPERDDQLYEAVSEGRRHPGMEHWLPLFQERMDTLFDYLDGAPIAIEPQGEDAARERFKQIADYYEARREAMEHPGGGAIYKPLPPDRLYLTEDEWASASATRALARLTPFAVPEGSADVIDAGARQGRNFAPERADTSVNVFEAVVAHVHALQAQRKKVMIALWSEGSRERMAQHAAATTSCPTHQRQHLAHGAGDAAQRGHAGGGRHGIRLRDRRCRRHQRAGHSRRPPGAAAQGQPQARQLHLRGHQPRVRRSRRACRARHRPLHRPADARGRRRAA